MKIISSIGGPHSVGNDFFRSLSKNLSKLVCSDFIVVAKLISAEKAETLAIWHEDKCVDNITYGLVGSPCEMVLKNGCCIYPDNVSDLFPNDIVLKNMNVRAYIGVPILSSTNEVIGILVALFKQALDNTDDHYCLMESFSSSAGAELERDQHYQKNCIIEHDLKKQVARLSQQQEVISQMTIHDSVQGGDFLLASHLSCQIISNKLDVENVAIWIAQKNQQNMTCFCLYSADKGILSSTEPVSYTHLTLPTIYSV